MRIYDMAVNGVENPIGYRLDHITLSWKVDETRATKQTFARIVIAADAAMTRELYDSGRRMDLLSTGVEIEGFSLAPRTRYYWTVTVENDTGETAVSEGAYFETGRMEEPWAAEWITADGVQGQNQVLTRSLSVRGPVAYARVYASAHGLYEMYLDDQKVGDEYLTPFCNSYDQWQQVETYDVTDALQAGDHELSVMLGDGWYKGRFGFQSHECNYGDTDAFIMELVVGYADGTRDVIVTDGQWSAQESPVRFANIYDGEVYDASFTAETHYPVRVLAESKALLCDRLSPAVRVVREFKPVSIIHTPAGETVLDMGQESTGWLAFRTDAACGKELKLLFGELLQDGNFYNENLRTAKAEFTYITDGTQTWVRPHFTFYGYRYVKLIGFERVREEDFTALVLCSDLTMTGSIHTNDPKINRLFENVVWGQRGNFLDVPTDCPQRDERMGWTGDAQAFSGTAMFNMDCRAFYRKFLYDMQREQEKHAGAVPFVVPAIGMPDDQVGSCAWADAATVIPWTLYLFYGDKALLRAQYPNMRMWTEWIIQQDEKDGGKRLWQTGFHFADWLALDNPEKDSCFGGTDPYFVATAYYFYSLTLTLRAARVLGEEADVRRYEAIRDEVRAAIEREYFTPNGRLAETTQTAYVLALFMDFVPEKDKDRMVSLLRAKFDVSGGKLRTGFVGTTYLNRVLSSVGLNDLAYSLLLNEEFPGWLYEVNMGATTIWERWNSVLPDGHVSDTGMNSLNHYAYGAVMEWVYRDVVGINPVEEMPGFKKALIRPRPNCRLTQVRGDFESAAGKYVSAWKILPDGRLELHVEIPFDATATYFLPNADAAVIAAQQPELNVTAAGDDVRVELESGVYDFLYMPVLPLK